MNLQFSTMLTFSIMHLPISQTQIIIIKLVTQQKLSLPLSIHSSHSEIQSSSEVSSMGNIISASSTATTRLQRPQHLAQDLEAGISARVSNNNSTGPNLQYEVATSINESDPNTGDEEDPSVEGNINLNLNVHDGDNNIGNGNNSNCHNLHNNIGNPNYNGNSMIGGNRNDPRMIGRNNTARLHDHPKVTAYVLRFFLPLWAIACVKLTGGNSKIANPFMIFSLVAFCMAILILSLLSWMFEHSEENSGPSSCYKILKGVYYVFCKLAFFSLLPALFTTN